jgi:hypothetical protein
LKFIAARYLAADWAGDEFFVARAYSRAAARGDVNIVKELHQKIGPMKYNYMIWKCMEQALAHGHMDMAEHLVVQNSFDVWFRPVRRRVWAGIILGDHAASLAFIDKHGIHFGVSVEFVLVAALTHKSFRILRYAVGRYLRPWPAEAFAHFVRRYPDDEASWQVLFGMGCPGFSDEFMRDGQIRQAQNCPNAHRFDRAIEFQRTAPPRRKSAIGMTSTVVLDELELTDATHLARPFRHGNYDSLAYYIDEVTDEDGDADDSSTEY